MNKLIILTAPSGSGKTSIARYLLNKYSDKLAFSVSAATRAPRGNEQNGVEYYFISEEDFRAKIEAHQFIEWEMVYEGKYYGTLKTEIERIWNEGKTPLLDIDVKGAMRVRQQFPENSLSVFIEPPSIEILKQRLQNRAVDSADNIEIRVNKASYELSFKNHFDKIILNNDLNTACKETETAVLAFLDRI